MWHVCASSDFNRVLSVVAFVPTFRKSGSFLKERSVCPEASPKKIPSKKNWKIPEIRWKIDAKIERMHRTYITSRNAWNIWSITIFTIFRKKPFAYVLFVSRIRKNINLDQHPDSTDRCTRIQRFNSVSSLMEIAHPLKPMSRALKIFKIFETFKKIFLNH